MSVDEYGYAEYSDIEAPTVSGFNELDDLICLQDDLEKEVRSLEDQLKKAKARLTDLAEHRVPNMMDEMGLESFRTKRGFEIEVRKTWRTSIAGDKKYPAIQWLDQNGHGAVVKRTVSVPFPVGKQEEAEALGDELRERFGTSLRDVKVEPQTLKALIKELMDQGKDVPLELFGAYEQRVAKIKR